jgi:hypothetical protein
MVSIRHETEMLFLRLEGLLNYRIGKLFRRCNPFMIRLTVCPSPLLRDLIAFDNVEAVTTHSN